MTIGSPRTTSPSPRDSVHQQLASGRSSPTRPAAQKPYDAKDDLGASSVIVHVPVASQLRALTPPWGPSHPPTGPSVAPTTELYALPPSVPTLTEESFQHPAVRDLFARCLAHQHRANPQHTQSEAPLACVIGLQELLAAATELTPAEREAFERTASYLKQTLQDRAEGHRIEGDYNFYPETIKQISDSIMVSDPDDRQYGQHAWFEPLGRLAYTARLSVQDTLSLAEAYTQAMRGEALQDLEREAVLLNRYCLDLTYLVYWRAVEKNPPVAGTEANVDPSKARQRQAEIAQRIREDQDVLADRIPILTLKETGLVPH